MNAKDLKQKADEFNGIEIRKELMSILTRLDGVALEGGYQDCVSIYFAENIVELQRRGFSIVHSKSTSSEYIINWEEISE
jgi:hypothetical protein